MAKTWNFLYKEAYIHRCITFFSEMTSDLEKVVIYLINNPFGTLSFHNLRD